MASALLDRRVLQREYLLAISRALTAELDLRDLLGLILRAAVELASGNAGMIALVNPDGRSLSVTAVYGIPTHLVEHFAPLLSDLPSSQADDHENAPNLMQQLREVAKEADMELSQLIRLPMSSGGKVVGLIYIFQGNNYFFSSDAPQLLRAFAEQAAIAVRNARLYEQVNKEKQRLDAILQNSADGVMILDTALNVTEVNQAFCHMTGWPAAEALDSPHGEVVRWADLRTSTDLQTAIANGWPLPGATSLYVEGDCHCYDGSCKHGRDSVTLGITYTPLFNEENHVTDIIANVRDLTRYREEEQLQKTFISIVSHELKTPVAIIKGYAGTLRRHDAKWSKEILDESLEVIEEEADSLTDLIDNLLEASRLQAGTFALEVSDDVYLPRLARKIAVKFGSQTDKHELTVDFPDDYPTIFGDERRLTQVLNNLVGNAIKYSPDGGTITISGEVHPNHVTVSVSDEGIGIPAPQQGRIFQKFARLDNALDRKTEGTGLGLYLTKSIVEAHGGRVWFANHSDTQPDARGVTFTFSLPRD